MSIKSNGNLVEILINKIYDVGIIRKPSHRVKKIDSVDNFSVL